MNSRRPSKPNLPNVPKPSKLLLQRGSAEPISSSAYRIPLLDHSIYQYEIGLFLTASQSKHQTAFSQILVWWEKVLVMYLSRI